MIDPSDSSRLALKILQKRADELNCLYKIKEILRQSARSLTEICTDLIATLPSGMRYPDVCRVKITLDNEIYTSSDFTETPWVHHSDIVYENNTIGSISVYYMEKTPPIEDDLFLEEEIKLIGTTAGLLAQHLMTRRMKTAVLGLKKAGPAPGESPDWTVLLETLKYTNARFYYRICRKIINILDCGDDEEARELLRAINSCLLARKVGYEDKSRIIDLPPAADCPEDFSQAIVRIARKYLSDETMLQNMQRWIQEEKLGSLAQVINRNLSLEEVADSIRRYYDMAPVLHESCNPGKWGIQVSLIRRFLSDRTPYIDIAKNITDIEDFNQLLKKVIFTTESRGKLGGKSALMFLIGQLIEKNDDHRGLFKNVRMPKTWYITSDVIYHFMHYNDFDEIVEQKYKDSSQIRLEYQHIVQSFKNGQFSNDIIKKLSSALDDLQGRPLIVRSSSLLEDQIGSGFTGRYKSVFLANRGSKKERLEALMDAVADVYASTFSPDPIEYRVKNGLLDFGEEMGIMIQEVVGRQMGKYFLPLYAGVACSDNQYRWSTMIKRDDGLLCIVPGLWIRSAVREEKDAPVLTAPGRPESNTALRDGRATDYYPRNITVINMETDRLETIKIDDFMKENMTGFPDLDEVFSVTQNDHLEPPSAGNASPDNLIPTFHGLLTRSSRPGQLKAVLDMLKQTFGMPVDVEFAVDGRDLYIVHCRTRSCSAPNDAVPIPKDIPPERIVFTANKFITGGIIGDIKYLVFVDPSPQKPAADPESASRIRRLIGRLNKILPKKQFVLIGSWKLARRCDDDSPCVAITTDDISNAAALVDLSVQPTGNLSDFSFENLFSRELTGAGVQYFRLDPDDPEIVFNRRFLRSADNILTGILPENRTAVDDLRLIDIRRSTDGCILKILMNDDLNEAVAFFASPQTAGEADRSTEAKPRLASRAHWRWRMKMAERIARRLDADRFGVKNIYVFGSTKNATAGPCSDIDLLVHFDGTPQQREELKTWLGGWSLCLDEMNYLQTGYRSDGLLDVQIITGDDIADKNCFAVMIDAVTDPARKLPMKDA